MECVIAMPTGRVRFYDAEKGFGFLTKDGSDAEVYVRASALPAGVASLKRGQRVEFGVIDGKRGEQALSVKVLEAPPSLSKAARKSPEQMAVLVEDLIKLLDGIGNGYRHNRHPDATHAAKAAQVHIDRAVADFTTTRICEIGKALPRQQGSEHKDRRANQTRLAGRQIVTAKGGGVDGHVASLALDTAAESVQDIEHVTDVAQLRQVM